MNQLDAFTEVISYLREQAPEEPRLKRALKVLEKRHEILRARHELRHAEVDDDLHFEPLTVTIAEVRAIFDGDRCVACFCKKPMHCCFCSRCWRDVDGATRKAFNLPSLYLQAFCRALRILGCEPLRDHGPGVDALRWGHVSRRHRASAPRSRGNSLQLHHPLQERVEGSGIQVARVHFITHAHGDTALVSGQELRLDDLVERDLQVGNFDERHGGKGAEI